MLLSAVLDATRPATPRRTRLVTISFMTEAIALDEKFGFVECAPLRSGPSGSAGGDTLHGALASPPVEGNALF
jgi:hypothetical protein